MEISIIGLIISALFVTAICIINHSNRLNFSEEEQDGIVYKIFLLMKNPDDWIMTDEEYAYKFVNRTHSLVIYRNNSNKMSVYSNMQTIPLDDQEKARLRHVCDEAIARFEKIEEEKITTERKQELNKQMIHRKSFEKSLDGTLSKDRIKSKMNQTYK